MIISIVLLNSIVHNCDDIYFKFTCETHDKCIWKNYNCIENTHSLSKSSKKSSKKSSPTSSPTSTPTSTPTSSPTSSPKIITSESSSSSNIKKIAIPISSIFVILVCAILLITHRKKRYNRSVLENLRYEQPVVNNVFYDNPETNETVLYEEPVSPEVKSQPIYDNSYEHPEVMETLYNLASDSGNYELAS